jgi:hypothetical protein
MSVKIRQHFCVNNGMGEEDGQRSTREREAINDEGATATRVAGGG